MSDPSDPADASPVPVAGSAPFSPSLARAAKVRRTTGQGRAWASRKRRALEARLPKLREARKAGLSNREIRENLAKDGFVVGRWLLNDLLREPPR